MVRFIAGSDGRLSATGLLVEYLLLEETGTLKFGVAGDGLLIVREDTP